MPYLTLTAAATLGVTFLMAAASKLRSQDRYRSFVRAVSRLAAPLPTRTTAAAVIGAECLVPVLLTVPSTRTAGFALAAMLLVALASAVARGVVRGQSESCPCFGPSTHPAGWVTVKRNAAMAILAIFGAYSHVIGPDGALRPAEAAAALGIAGVLVVLAVNAEDLVALFTTSPVQQRSQAF